MEITSVIKVNKIKAIGNNQGRNSEVFLAHDPQLGGNVALKEIPISKFNNPSEYFVEAQTLYANKHPRVVPIMYACQDTGFIRLTMPYFDNGSVQNVINKNPLMVKQVIILGQQFLDGLHFVHLSGYIHFDIKPTNILIGNDGSAMLADFGQTRPTDVLGTASIPPLYPVHIAPEILGSSRATKLTDIYQCGLTLYRLCNGEQVFRGQLNNYISPLGIFTPEYVKAILTGKFPNRSYFLPHVPNKLKSVIKKALAVDPAKRHQSVVELMNDLGQVATLLDWQYTMDNNGIKWVKNNIEHMYQIMILYNKSNKLWYVEGNVIRNSDGLSRNRKAWTSLSGFRTCKQAEAFVRNIFNKMEG
ncbi:Serine/threonine protein kinase [Desulfosporosinus sp. I2]|uniref:serine/threonine-protein kinase n=1 Tax=Desulfosporosinus sp. I2 TaxID=1617025 RepID=UPI00061E5839|nr:serine/threonine-protein kinase [Desulfosporosinus sp. I2]KJR49318.1 Serine/threonine protein kinase [Desulfosporosinus sp. I2]